MAFNPKSFLGDDFVNKPADSFDPVAFVSEPTPKAQPTNQGFDPVAFLSGKVQPQVREQVVDSTFDQLVGLGKNLKVGAARTWYGMSAGVDRMDAMNANKIAQWSAGKRDAAIERGDSPDGWKVQRLNAMSDMFAKISDKEAGWASDADAARASFMESNDDLTKGLISEVAQGVGGMWDIIPSAMSFGLFSAFSSPTRMFDEGFTREMELSGDEDKALDVATAYVFAASPIEMAADMFIFKGKGQATKKAALPFLKQVAKKMGMNFVSEGTTEVLQESILNKLTGQKMFTPESLRTFIVSGLVGSIAGGASAVHTQSSIARRVGELERQGIAPEDAVKVVNMALSGDQKGATEFLESLDPSLAGMYEAMSNISEEDSPLNDKEVASLKSLSKKDVLSDEEEMQLSSIIAQLPADEQEIIMDGINNVKGGDKVFDDLISRLTKQEVTQDAIDTERSTAATTVAESQEPTVADIGRDADATTDQQVAGQEQDADVELTVEEARRIVAGANRKLNDAGSDIELVKIAKAELKKAQADVRKAKSLEAEKTLANPESTTEQRRKAINDIMAFEEGEVKRLLSESNDALQNGDDVLSEELEAQMREAKIRKNNAEIRLILNNINNTESHPRVKVLRLSNDSLQKSITEIRDQAQDAGVVAPSVLGTFKTKSEAEAHIEKLIQTASSSESAKKLLEQSGLATSELWEIKRKGNKFNVVITQKQADAARKQPQAPVQPSQAQDVSEAVPTAAQEMRNQAEALEILGGGDSNAVTVKLIEMYGAEFRRSINEFEAEYGRVPSADDLIYLAGLHTGKNPREVAQRIISELGDPKVTSQEKPSQIEREAASPTPIDQPKPKGTPDTGAVGISRRMRKIQNEQNDIENTPLPDTEEQTTLLQDAIEQDIDTDILIDELAANPRVLDDIEVASLTIRTAEIVDEIESLKSSLDGATEDEQSDIESQIGALLSYLEKVEAGVSSAGTKMGRALAAMNMRLIRGTYDLATSMSRARKAKGSKLTDKNRETVSKNVDSVNKQQEKIDKMLGDESADIFKATKKKDLERKAKEYLSYLEKVHREIKDKPPAKDKSEEQSNLDRAKRVLKQQDDLINFINMINGRDVAVSNKAGNVFDPEGYVATLNNLKKKLADENKKKAKTQSENKEKARRLKRLNDEIDEITAEIERVYRVIPKKKPKTAISEAEILRNELRTTRSQQDRVIELQAILNSGVTPEKNLPSRKDDKEGYVAMAENLAKQIKKEADYKRYLEAEIQKEKTLDDKIAQTTENIQEVKRTIEKDTKSKPLSIKQKILNKLKGVERDQDRVIELQNIFNQQIVEVSNKDALVDDPEGLKAMAKNLRKMILDSAWYKEAKANPTKVTKKRIAMLEEQIQRLEEQAEGMYRDIKKGKVIEDPAVEMLKDRIKFMKEEMRLGDELAVVNEDIRLISEGRYSEVDEIKRRNKKSTLVKGLDKERAELRMRQDTLNQSINELSRNGAGKVFMDVADFLRAMKLSLDTWIGRQGVKALYSDPKMALSAFKDSMVGSLNDSKFYELSRQIEGMPTTKHGRQHGLEIMEAGGTFELHQEAMNSKLAEKFPFVRWSNRNMVLGINSLRAKMYQKWFNRYPNESPEFYQNVASFINEWTGRGTLGKLEKGAHGLSAIFTAPRWVTSNWQVIASERHAWVKNPKTGKKELDPRLLKEIATQKAKAALGFGMIASMMVAAGWEIEEDPEEGDFMKLRKGDMVIDIMPGLSANLRLVGVLAESVAARFGIGELEGRSSFSEVSDRYLSYKYAPIIGSVREFITGENAVGDEREIEETIILSMTPIMLESIYQDYFKDLEDLKDVAKTQGIQWFGFGAALYEDRGL